MAAEDKGFWDLIGVLAGSSGEESVARLRDQLTSLPAAQVDAFDHTLTAKLTTLDQEPYATRIAQLPGVGPSHDEGLFVRCAVVAAGEQRYTQVLENPALLDAGWDTTGADLLWGVAATAFEEVTGEPLAPAEENPAAPSRLPWIELVYGDAQLRPRIIWEPLMDHQSRRLSSDPGWVRWRTEHQIKAVWIHLSYRADVKAAGTERLRVGLRDGVVWVTMLRDRDHLPRLPTPRAAATEADELMSAIAERLRKRLGRTPETADE